MYIMQKSKKRRGFLNSVVLYACLVCRDVKEKAMKKRKEKMEYRYYEMPDKEWVMPLLGEEWIRSYGLDYTHFHNYMEVGVCHYGKGEVIIEDQHYPFCGGQVTLIPPNVPHDTRSIGEKSYWEWLYIDVVSILEEMYSDDRFVAEKIKKEVYADSFFLEQNDYPAFMDILRAIIRESKEKQYMYRESIKGYLRSFIIEILRMNKCERSLNRIDPNRIIISAALEYTDQHYQEEVKISEMAAACNISESYFRKLFLEYMGIKPLDYLNLIRVWKACKLMGKTSSSIESISYEAGFKTESTFIRNFKKVLGVTPYQWKISDNNSEGKLYHFRITAQKGW